MRRDQWLGLLVRAMLVGTAIPAPAGAGLFSKGPLADLGGREPDPDTFARGTRHARLAPGF